MNHVIKFKMDYPWGDIEQVEEYKTKNTNEADFLYSFALVYDDNFRCIVEDDKLKLAELISNISNINRLINAYNKLYPKEAVSLVNKYFKENDFINILYPIIEKVDNEFINLYSLGADYYPDGISVDWLSEDYIVILREKSSPVPALMYDNFDDKTKAQLFADTFDKDTYDISVKHIKIEN